MQSGIPVAAELAAFCKPLGGASSCILPGETWTRDSHPAVLRLVRLVCEEAGDTPVWVCGELAGRPETVPVLLRLGVRNLSVAPPLLPGVRNAVRQVDLRQDDS